MKSSELSIVKEIACYGAAIETLNAQAFGPGRFARTAFRLREGVEPEMQLGFVALIGTLVAGAVRVTKINIGGQPALVLGPLVVDPKYKNKGIGSALMRQCVDACRETGHGLIILVGDAPYYRPFGFKPIAPGQIQMPGPVDPQRLLACELVPGVLAEFSGLATAFSCPHSSEREQQER